MNNDESIDPKMINTMQYNRIRIKNVNAGPINYSFLVTNGCKVMTKVGYITITMHVQIYMAY